MVEVEKPEPQVRVWYWDGVNRKARFFTMPLKDFESKCADFDLKREKDHLIHVTRDGKWAYSVPAKSIVMVEAFDE